jgi:hypothetical protein
VARFGHVRICAERPVDSVVVTLDGLQTRENDAFDGRVAGDGKPFFPRAWNLHLP